MQGISKKVPYTILKGRNILISNELAVRLAAEVHGRISQYASKPELIYITTDEMKKMSELYPNNVLLTALTNTASVVKKNPTMDRSRVLSTVHSIAERVLLASHAKGKNIVFKGKAYAAPKPAQLPVSAPNRERLMELWKSVVATNNDWIPMDEWCDNLLRMYDFSTVQSAIDNLERTYADTEAQAALDAVAWKCEQIVMVAL